MKIRQIVLENYRQYRGETVIDLSCDAHKNINIIQGANGFGKTNLVSAINWCLYGKEGFYGEGERLDPHDNKRLPIVNNMEIREAGTGQKACAKVVLKIVDEKNNDLSYTIQREICAHKHDDQEYTIENDVFSVYLQPRGRGDTEEIRDTALFMNKFLPEQVKSFFFFDGEKLDEFFKTEKSVAINRAIFDVSQLGLLEKATKDLESTIAHIRQSVKGQSPRIDEIDQEIREQEGKRDRLRQEKEEKEKKLLETRGELDRIEKELQDYNVPLVKELSSRRKNLEDIVLINQDTIEETDAQAKGKLIEIGAYVYGKEAILFAGEQIEHKVKRGEIPPKITQQFVKELLERGDCICGTDVSANNKAKQKLEELLQDVKSQEEYGSIVDLKYTLKNVLESASRFPIEQSSLRKRIADLEERNSKIKDEIANIEKRLAGIDEVKVANLEATRSNLKKQEETLVSGLGVARSEIEKTILALEQKRREYEAEIRKLSKLKIIEQRIKLGNKTLEELGRIQQKLIDEVRTTIQEKTKTHFMSLALKKETYDDVKISKTYDISVINKLGEEILYSLSAGERQVLALSFLAALREVSGFDAPIIIDTPLSRISDEPRENIARLLPEFLKDAQLTMLMTESEYTSSVRSALAGKVGKEYQLEYDDKNMQTKVKPYGRS